MMQITNYSKPPTWIEARLRKDHGIHDDEYTISHIVPDRYEAYCKLMNPIFRDPTVADYSIMWNQENDNETVTNHKNERVFYKELAVCYDIPLPAICDKAISIKLNDQFPRYLFSETEEGSMDREVYENLLKHLVSHTGEQSSYFYYDEMKILSSNSYSGIPAELSGKLYVGSLGEVLDFFENIDLNHTPTFWWPEDKSWCVATDYDCSYSVVGGSRELINELLNDKELEAIEVDIHMRIDRKYLKELLLS